MCLPWGQTLLSSVFVLASAASMFAQKADSPDELRALVEAERSVAHWQRRVDSLTQEIKTESSAVPDCERSMYLAFLAKIWWKIDEDQSRQYLKLSAEKLLAGLQSDENADAARKLKFAQKTVEIIFRIDQKLGQTLISQIEGTKVEAGGDKKKEDPALAELFANIGLQVVDTKLELALSCGFDSLMFGVADSLPRLIAELNAKDTVRSELLFRQAILKVRGSYSTASLLFINAMGKYLFDVYKGKTFSETMRRYYLASYSDLVSEAALIETERPNRCQIAFYAPSVFPRIDEYLPAMSQTFRQNIQTCLPYVAATAQELTRASADTDQPQTVDELIRATRQNRASDVKLRYFRKAFLQLEKEKKYLEMISILDGTDGDTLKAISSASWNDFRIDASCLGSLESFEAKDLPSAYRIVERTPKIIRPTVRFRILKKLSGQVKDQFYLDNLDEMAKELSSTEADDKEKVGFFRFLAEEYLNVRPTESELMFRNAVKFINKTDGENPDFVNSKDWAAWLDYVPMASELLDTDEQSITASLNNISSRRSRVRLKLGLLESSLTRLVEEKRKLSELKKSKRTYSNLLRYIRSGTTSNHQQNSLASLDTNPNNS